MKVPRGYCLPALLFMLSIGSGPVMATEFKLSNGEIGPFAVSTQIHIRESKEELVAYPGHVAEFTATVRNDSQWPIRHAQFCVQTGRRTKGCDFEFSNKWIWMPGEELTWMIDKHARRGMDKVTAVMLIKVTVDTQAAKLSH